VFNQFLTKKISMRTNFAIATILALTFTACDSSQPKETTPAPAATAIMPVDSTKSYDIALVNNKKDPACGMPVTAGIADTAHYKDKVLGFCGTECKNEFNKHPEALIAAAEIK
jgi:YHS domain-containing protein